jgi:L,D-peptidoglycan transpeptidase YkuD (ErfK/YbiS/YcfS/YnhG family)
MAAPSPPAGPARVTSAPTPPIAAAGGPPAPPAELAQAEGAGQAVVVSAAKYGATGATFNAYQMTPAGWQKVFGPWAAYIGRRGFAPPGSKREGDGRTPSGTFGFDFFFGVKPDPGVKFPYRQTGRSIVWSDDPSSPLYNQWVDTAAQDPGANPEPMYVSPAYSYGAVIDYNNERVPGQGSAIFLHVSMGRPTSGCVSLPAGQLLQVLRWLDPALRPRIIMGVASG